MKKQMVKMVRGRDYNLRSLSGHSIRFKKNVPVDVPPEVVEEAMSIGAFPVDDDDVDVGEEVTNTVVEPPSGAEREELITAAMENMKIENNRSDFDANSKPNVKKLSARVGFEVSAQERNKLWDLMQEDDA